MLSVRDSQVWSRALKNTFPASGILAFQLSYIKLIFYPYNFCNSIFAEERTCSRVLKVHKALKEYAIRNGIRVIKISWVWWLRVNALYYIQFVGQLVYYFALTPFIRINKAYLWSEILNVFYLEKCYRVFYLANKILYRLAF